MEQERRDDEIALRLAAETGVGLGALTVERSFFPENERNDQERSHRSEKKTNAFNGAKYDSRGPRCSKRWG